MGSFSIWHWLIVLAIVLILFGGAGRLSGIMGELGKCIRSFKKEVSGEDGKDQPKLDKPEDN
jgi:sec-independent protein translocase protein TatA